MKKFIAAALLLVLVVSMLGCSTSGPATRGTVTNGVYTNDYFGLSFVIPDGWKALSDEEYAAKFPYPLPTNEELAEFESEFKDLRIEKVADDTDYIIISYSMLFDKGSTDNQIKNKIAMVASSLQFGIIDPITIGDAEYSIMAGTAEDSTKTTYYIWSKEMIGKFRPLIWVVVDSNESIDNIVSGFSTISE
ncbi:MAG TPA: hypothetical protein PK629_06645 [Oscillospiraceae bacterium]|nr:hypothetical protein [Oscillospiraceae bacterium]HPF55313.1 hypothetical protein [Clostridiales bacterium]HPK36103.1 hypothetical protein [Oscillospiraceae bacterium]HPR76618.1 hypothetical protein [Oscillospiraceae bacterium]